MLVFDSETKEELLKDVAALLRRSANQYQTDTARTKTEKALNTARANALIVVAMSLETAHIQPKQEYPFPVPHTFEPGELHPDTCAVCSKFERYTRFHKMN